MKIKKLFGALTCSALLFTSVLGTFCACTPSVDDNGGNGSGDAITYQTYAQSTVNFSDNSSSLTDFDQSIYYINDLKQDMGDPMIVYDEQNKMFYAFGTHTAREFQCFASPNLQDWQSLGANDQYGFKPSIMSWSRYDLWAPDIQKIGDKWYMYYTAQMDYGDQQNCQIGVAIADQPYGPYKQFTGANADGQNITLKDTPFTGLERTTILDSHVFQDDNGDLYMYISINTGNTTPELREKYGIVNTGVQEIWGCKMKDAVTWDLSTFKRLIIPGYKTVQESVDGKEPSIAWENWSESFDTLMECAEGPYMIKSNGKYYLTYVANSYVDTVYNVGYAVSESPLGDYEKPDETYLQNMILGVPGQLGDYVNTRYLGHMTGTGHASVFRVGDEYMFAYHAHSNRHKWGASAEESGSDANSEYRSLAVDYIYFDDNGVPYTNGPTYSLNRLPALVSGYKNLIGQATIKAEGENVQFLNDVRTTRGFGKLKDEVVNQATFKAGTRSIEITFATPVEVKAINIFNSATYDMRTEKIKQIDFGDGKGIVDIAFNPSYVNASQKVVRPHTAYNVSLTNTITTSRIVITFESATDFAVGEIEILGK